MTAPHTPWGREAMPYFHFGTVREGDSRLDQTPEQVAG